MAGKNPKSGPGDLKAKPAFVRLGSYPAQRLHDLDGLFQVYWVQYAVTPPVKQIEKSLSRAGGSALVIFAGNVETLLDLFYVEGSQCFRVKVENEWLKKLLSEIEERYRRTEDALEVADWVRESIRAYSEGQIARRKRPYRNYGLFSEHFLVNRLPESEEWREDPEPVRAKLQRLYREKEALLKDANEAQTEEEFIRPVLEVLGFAYWVQDTTKATGGPQRPDYVLYPDEDTKRKAVGHKTDEVKRYAPALAIAEAKYWGRDMT